MVANVADLSRSDTLDPEHIALVRPILSGSWLTDSRLVYAWAGLDGRTQAWVADVETGTNRVSSLPFLRGEMGDVVDRRDMSGGLQVRPGSSSEIAFLGGDPSQPERTAVWIGDLETGRARAVTDHPEQDRSPRWSPDGQRLAYVAQRSGRHHIFTVGADGIGSRQLTHDRFENVEPVFSPDGTSILYSSQRGAEDPFSYSLCLIDSETGEGTRLTFADNACDRSGRWSPDGEWIVFISDRDGHDNIWRIRPDGSELTQVTATSTDKADPQLTPDGHKVYFVETEGVRSWISALSLGSGDTTALSTQDGVAAAPRLSPDTGRLLFAHSDHAHPFELFVLETDGRQRKVTAAAGSFLERVAHSRPEIITVPTADGLEMECLYYPAMSGQTGPAPAVLYIHGGPNASVQDSWAPQLQLMAQRGVAVLAPNYRGSLGYGRAWRDAIVGAPAGEGEVRDWLTARAHLDAMPEVDSSRVVAMGRSYGSFAAMTLLTTSPDDFVGGVAISGVSDWLEFWEEAGTSFMRQLARWFFGSGDRIPDREVMRSRSPLFSATDARAPFLFVHGEDDEVAISQSRRMAVELEGAGVSVQRAWYPGEGHVFSSPFAIVDSNRKIVAFLTDVLDLSEVGAHPETLPRRTQWTS